MEEEEETAEVVIQREMGDSDSEEVERIEFDKHLQNNGRDHLRVSLTTITAM